MESSIINATYDRRRTDFHSMLCLAVSAGLKWSGDIVDSYIYLSTKIGVK